MQDMFTLTQIKNGTVEGVINKAYAIMPEVQLCYQGQTVMDAVVSKGEDKSVWALSVDIPIETINDGIQIYILQDKNTEEQLGSFSMISGDVLSNDTISEVRLLRAELDMVKQVMRKHFRKNDTL